MTFLWCITKGIQGGIRMDSYEINEETMAIVPVGEKESKIYELDDELDLPFSTKKIMENSCEYFGSSLEGRQLGTTSVTGFNYKVPILIEESKRIIFFPTVSPNDKSCVWLSLKYVDRIHKVGDKVCVEFCNGKKLLLPISYRMITNQILRAYQLDSIMRERIENTKNL